MTSIPKFTGAFLPRKIHRRDEAVLVAGLGAWKGRERVCALEKRKRFLVERRIARRFRHSASDDLTPPVQFKSNHHGAGGSMCRGRIALETLHVAEHERVVGFRGRLSELADAISLRRRTRFGGRRLDDRLRRLDFLLLLLW